LISAQDVEAFEQVIVNGGLAVFPSDTVYGLGCSSEQPEAIERLYELKGRPPAKPSALMWFSLDAALDALEHLGPRTRAAFERILPGPVLALVPGPGGGTLGVRVPRLEAGLEALGAARVVLLQTSANLTGGPDPRRLADVPEPIRAGVDFVLDGGELPGTASTVVDLSRYEEASEWEILREGAIGREALAGLLEG
jgi:L-threonylcarbamoyladenylate synthase